MLLESNIGIGIFGREGTQAARSADYAIHLFHHLKPLVMKHGRYCSFRFVCLSIPRVKLDHSTSHKKEVSDFGRYVVLLDLILLRAANYVQYFFYKNLVFIFPQFYFAFWSAYTAQTMYLSFSKSY